MSETTTVSSYQGSNLITYAALLSMFGVILLALWPTLGENKPETSSVAWMWLMIWLCSALVFSVLSLRVYVLGYLCSLFCFMITWRISVLANATMLSEFMCLPFFCFLTNFIYTCRLNLRKPQNFMTQLSVTEWHLVFVRLYVGLDFIPHFTEKLFAGSEQHGQVVQAFIHLGLPYPDLFVWLAGMCEFLSAVGIGLGLFVRPVAVFCSLYLLIATFLGHHFSLGFMWVRPGGGWEFAVLWTMIIFPFAISGAHSFSLDQYLKQKSNVPSFFKWLL